MDDYRRALLGDREAAKRLTDAGVLVPCPWCKKNNIMLNGEFKHWVFCLECGADGPNAANENAARLAWNTRAPILSAEEVERLGADNASAGSL